MALLGLVGLVALGVGIGPLTIWQPDDEVTSSIDLSEGGPVAITAPGVPEMRDGPVTITATSVDGGPVLLARGREADVTAWVEGAHHTVVTGLETETAFKTKVVDGEDTVPDPSTSPMWVQTEPGDSSATMTWDPPIGRWQLFVSGDGTSAAAETLTMTWPNAPSTPVWVPIVIVLGALLVLAAVGLGAWWFGPLRRRRDSRRSAHAHRAPTASATPVITQPLTGPDDTQPVSVQKSVQESVQKPERTP